MAFDFVLPDLGEGITEGEIRKWLIQEGEEVLEHQPVLEVETDKAIVEVPSPRKGRIGRIYRAEGEMVKVGEPLMTIREEGEGEAAEERPRSVSVVGILPEEPDILATPAARARAKELGINLETMRGSGPGGSVTIEDVRKAGAEAVQSAYPPAKEGPEDRVPMRGIRRTIAKNLLATQRSTAFVTAMDEVDVTELWEVRAREKAALTEKGIHLTFLPFIIKAVQHGLAGHPLLNASVDEEREEIVIKKYCNMGIAVDTPEGLMVPVIRDVEKKSIMELAEEIQGLSQRARDRKISLEEMKGSSFTITNFGHSGGTFATPIINHPDVAILGTGRISDKPWVKEGRIVIGKILPLSLTFDHRVTDGADASKFLSQVMRYLEDPALLFIESA